MKMKLLRIGILALLSVSVVAGIYFLAQRMLRDRNAAMAYRERVARPINVPTTTRTVRKYNSKDLEEARQPGDKRVPPQAAAVQANATNDAVQRNLRTLDEINRINQMNQRMMEQQERMRRQNKN
jgi:hypothetical protein